MAQTPPDLESVRSAVSRYLGNDGVNDAARAELIEWGPSALPHLERLVRAADADVRQGMAIVLVLRELGTPSALGLLVEILAGRTPIRADLALGVVPILLRMPEQLDLLALDPAFKPAMLGFAAPSGNYLGKSHVARMAAALGWTDLIPRIREMLDDEHLYLREAAAEALSSLTGQRVREKRPTPTFPGRALRNGLLGEPRSIAAERPRAPSLPRGQTVELNAPGEPTRSVALVRDADGLARNAVCRDEHGNELWSFRVPISASSAALAPLWGASGIYGVAIESGGGPQGIVALDASGGVLWQAPNLHVVYALRSHAELPGLLLSVGSGVTLFEHDRSGARERDLVLFGAGPRSHHSPVDAQLFPAEDGGAAWISVGLDAEPALFRRDARPEQRWKAILPGHAPGIALLEPAAHPRMIAVATRPGDLFVLDVRGTLLWEGRLPAAEGEDVLPVNGIEASAVDGRWSLVVHRLSGSFAYDVDLSAR